MKQTFKELCQEIESIIMREDSLLKKKAEESSKDILDSKESVDSDLTSQQQQQSDAVFGNDTISSGNSVLPIAKPEIQDAGKTVDFFAKDNNVAEAKVEEDDDDDEKDSEDHEMTLDDAIEHLKDSLSDPEHDWSCDACKHEHEQLLGWLEELKQIKQSPDKESPIDRGDDLKNYLNDPNMLANDALAPEVTVSPDAPEATSITEVDSSEEIKATIPLFLKMLEYAREDAEDDVDLHYAVENILELAKSGRVLTMEDYSKIIDIYEDSDDEESDDDETFGEAKKKKKYKKRKCNNTAKWSRYFPRIPWLIPVGWLPPPAPGPKPPPAPTPAPEPTPAPDTGGDMGDIGGGDIGSGDAGAGAAPIGEAETVSVLNEIDPEVLKQFIVKEFGSKFSSKKAIVSGKDKEAEDITLKQIVSPTDFDSSNNEDSVLLFIKFEVGKAQDWVAIIGFDADTRKFEKTKFVKPEFEVFTLNDEDTAKSVMSLFPKLYEIKTF